MIALVNGWFLSEQLLLSRQAVMYLCTTWHTFLRFICICYQFQKLAQPHLFLFKYTWAAAER